MIPIIIPLLACEVTGDWSFVAVDNLSNRRAKISKDLIRAVKAEELKGQILDPVSTNSMNHGFFDSGSW
jgi:hypothetical protein